MQFKKLNSITTISLVLAVAMSLSAAEYVPGELIVKLEHGILDPGTTDETPLLEINIANQGLAGILEQYGAYSVERVFKGIFTDPTTPFTTKSGEEVYFRDLSQVYLFRMEDAENIADVAHLIGNIPGVIYAEPNYVGEYLKPNPDDPGFGNQWGLNNDNYGWDVGALRAWDVETGNTTVKIAILDTGLEPEHYDGNEPHIDEFENRIFRIVDFTGSPYGTADVNSHGTHTAGIAAAYTSNGAGHSNNGVAGVAGGWNGENGVRLIIAKIGDSAPDATACAQAIEWATTQGANVLNGSWHIGSSSTVKNAIKNAFAADMTLFFSSGNYPQHPDIDDVVYPAELASYDICCAVGAMDENGTKASFSCYGPELSFVAPGVDIYSTSIASRGYYEYKSGTSMSSPMAAGVAGLLYSAAEDAPNCDLYDVDCKRILEITASDIETYGTGWDIQTGYGCVNAFDATRHMYWPYKVEHGTIRNSTLQEEYLGYQQRQFLDSPKEGLPAGTYFCDVYKLSATVEFAYDYFGTPDVWERLLDEPTGFNGSNPNNAWYDVNISSVTTYSAHFETFVYYLRSNGVQQINEWAPYDKDDITIAYTVHGMEDKWAIIGWPTPPSNNFGQYPTLAVDPVELDYVHISCYDAQNGNLLYGFKNASMDVVDAAGDVGQWTSIALDESGIPHISYYDATNTQLKYAVKSGGSWSVEVADNSGDVGVSSDISIDPQGYPHMVCYNATIGLPEHVWKDAAGWHMEPIGLAGNFCDVYTAGVVEDDGDLHGCAYFVTPDGQTHGLGYAYRPASGGPDVYEVVESNGNVGKYCDIVLDEDGKPHISYYDVDNMDLKYAYRDEFGWHTQIVNNALGDPNVDVGRWTSICIDDDGYPVIFYQITTNENVACSKKLTTGGWKYEQVESTGSLGNYGTAVGIDNLGRMVFAYYDGTNGKLRYGKRARWPQYWNGMKSPILGAEEDHKPIIAVNPAIVSVTPNPTVGSATISYHLPNTTDTRITIYDVTGREVKTLVSGEVPAGKHELTWQAIDDAGRSVSAGVYFISMKAGGFQASEKVTLIR